MKFKILKESRSKNPSVFPREIKFDGKLWYRDKQMDNDVWAYVNWDDENNEHYITVNSSGYVEYN